MRARGDAGPPTVGAVVNSDSDDDRPLNDRDDAGAPLRRTASADGAPLRRKASMQRWEFGRDAVVVAISAVVRIGECRTADVALLVLFYERLLREGWSVAPSPP